MNLTTGSLGVAGAVIAGVAWAAFAFPHNKSPSPLKDSVIQAPTVMATSKAKRRAVYSFGYGQFGQLMQGSEMDSFIPKRINLNASIRVQSVQASVKTSGLLTADGNLYMCGFGKDNRLGVPSSKDVTSPMLITLASKQVQLALSEFGGAVIDEHGKLQTWGRNWSGENGNEESSKSGAPEQVQLPSQAGGNVRITSVARGRQHTLFCDELGRVYACGNAVDGALGLPPASLGDGKSVRAPVQIPGLENIVQVACGRDFSFALSASGELFSFGKDRWGQLGLGGGSSDRPQRVPGLPPIKQVSCGENFTAVVTAAEGLLYVCGNGQDGQLGSGSNRAADANLFQRVHEGLSSPVRQVSCGGGHIACILEDGRLMIWGRGRNGQLGRSDHIESVASPRLAPVECTFFANKQVLQVSCGADHTLVLVEEEEE